MFVVVYTALRLLSACRLLIVFIVRNVGGCTSKKFAECFIVSGPIKKCLFEYGVFCSTMTFGFFASRCACLNHSCAIWYSA